MNNTNYELMDRAIAHTCIEEYNIRWFTMERERLECKKKYKEHVNDMTTLNAINILIGLKTTKFISNENLCFYSNPFEHLRKISVFCLLENHF